MTRYLIVIRHASIIFTTYDIINNKMVGGTTKIGQCEKTVGFVDLCIINTVRKYKFSQNFALLYISPFFLYVRYIFTFDHKLCLNICINRSRTGVINYRGHEFVFPFTFCLFLIKIKNSHEGEGGGGGEVKWLTITITNIMEYWRLFISTSIITRIITRVLFMFRRLDTSFSFSKLSEANHHHVRAHFSPLSKLFILYYIFSYVLETIDIYNPTKCTLTYNTHRTTWLYNNQRILLDKPTRPFLFSILYPRYFPSPSNFITSCPVPRPLF